MKKFIILILCIIISLDIIDNRYLNNNISNYLKHFFTYKDFNVSIDINALNNNKYKYKEFGNKVKSTTNFYATSEDDLLNIYYTFLNNGFDDFTYYCDYKYSDCLSDIKKISENEKTFSYINHIVHPYYTFKTINSKYINLNRRVDININKKYSKKDIEKIENKMNEIINNLNINSYDSLNEKIKVFHDYLVDNNIYDKNKEVGTSKYHSDSAIGTLFEGYSVCSGYSDTMGIFLNKLGLDNVIVVTDNHAWNAVKINNNWYHIDITWDDPIVSDGSNMISHNYFLLTTNELLKKDTTQHNFDRNLYDFLN